ncbi:uncharacterized protein LOC135228295 [Loxodonta africana]|uniref:uncharacterized protein LOC135228295 n=1 Tax=Loxodonta africana TaxID=9785 RepID=UPI0030D26B6C
MAPSNKIEVRSGGHKLMCHERRKKQFLKQQRILGSPRSWSQAEEDYGGRRTLPHRAKPDNRKQYARRGSSRGASAQDWKVGGLPWPPDRPAQGAQLEPAAGGAGGAARRAGRGQRPPRPLLGDAGMFILLTAAAAGGAAGAAGGWVAARLVLWTRLAERRGVPAPAASAGAARREVVDRFRALQAQPPARRASPRRRLTEPPARPGFLAGRRTENCQLPECGSKGMTKYCLVQRDSPAFNDSTLDLCFQPDLTFQPMSRLIFTFSPDNFCALCGLSALSLCFLTALHTHYPCSNCSVSVY